MWITKIIAIQSLKLKKQLDFVETKGMLSYFGLITILDARNLGLCKTCTYSLNLFLNLLYRTWRNQPQIVPSKVMNDNAMISLGLHDKSWFLKTAFFRVMET